VVINVRSSTNVSVSSYCYVCVFMLRYLCLAAQSSAGMSRMRRQRMNYHICVLVQLYMCPRPNSSVLCPRAGHAVSGHARTSDELLNMCPRTAIHVPCSPEQYTRYQDMREQRMKALIKRKQRAKDIALLSSEAEVLHSTKIITTSVTKPLTKPLTAKKKPLTKPQYSKN
jgi:hypothetical protein